MFSTDKLKVETADGQNVTLLEPFTYTRRDGCIITVPPGTTSDGASTPPAMWAALPPFGHYWKAAILHDYLYRDSGLDKDYCDETFLEAMESLNVSEVEQQTLYQGVHLFGQEAFDEDREQTCSKHGFAEPTKKEGSMAAKLFQELKDRILGNPTSTLGGALVGSITLSLQSLLGNVDWSAPKQAIATAVSTGVPLIVGALFKSVPKNNTIAHDLTQRITAAITTAAEQAAAAATEKVIAEVQKIGSTPSQVPAAQEGAKA